ncbi:MAG: hypothetical protein WAX44_01050 [Minisyncoccia bacterium]
MRRFHVYWGGRLPSSDSDDRRNEQVVTVGPFREYSEMVDWTIEFTRIVIGNGNSVNWEEESISDDFDSSLTPEEVWERVKEIRRKS